MVKIFRQPQNPLETYLKAHNEAPHHFAIRSDIPPLTIYRVLKTNSLFRKTAVRIIEATNGELTLEDFGFFE